MGNEDTFSQIEMARMLGYFNLHSLADFRKFETEKRAIVDDRRRTLAAILKSDSAQAAIKSLGWSTPESLVNGLARLSNPEEKNTLDYEPNELKLFNSLREAQFRPEEIKFLFSPQL